MKYEIRFTRSKFVVSLWYVKNGSNVGATLFAVVRTQSSKYMNKITEVVITLTNYPMLDSIIPEKDRASQIRVNCARKVNFIWFLNNEIVTLLVIGKYIVTVAQFIHSQFTVRPSWNACSWVNVLCLVCVKPVIVRIYPFIIIYTWPNNKFIAVACQNSWTMRQKHDEKK